MEYRREKEIRNNNEYNIHSLEYMSIKQGKRLGSRERNC